MKTVVVLYSSEGVNWSGELITEYSFWGKEIQSIRITYKGENPEQLNIPNFM